MSRLLRMGIGFCVFAASAAVVTLVAAPIDTVAPSPSSALRAANPAMLSSGVFSSLDAEGAFGALPPPRRARAGTQDISKGRPPLVLDARVGTNIRVGDDPAALPASQRGQAEPHIYRSAANPARLLATFQEGRFNDAGALDCGYAVSADGGLTWTRALIPQLTPASGGTYLRATDPVAAIGPQGDLYLNTLGAVSGAFDLAAVLVSRSTDDGATWSAPAVVFQTNTTQVAPDKNWIAVNDYPATATTGRLFVTWTNFTSGPTGASTGNNLVGAVSDDRGPTWSAPVVITEVGSINQGSQPVFLPDGSLIVVYTTFANLNTTSPFAIQCKRSLDGGRTFPNAATTVVGSVAAWDDPDLRDGVFLTSAAVARSTGEIFVTYTAVVSGSPRVLVTKSSDAGNTWSAPVVVSDNPAGVSVTNPAVAVTPDGRTVSVVFMDRRHSSASTPVVDHYVAQSFDGGLSWQPNIRLTEMSSDIRYAAQTTRGAMLGDYLGVAPALSADQPCVAIWCDTRTGDADPFTVRFAPSPDETFAAWALVNNLPSNAADDSDGDRFFDAVEFQLGTKPRLNESGETFALHQVSPGVFDIAWVERSSGTGFPVSTAVNPPASGIVLLAASGTPLTAAQLPSVVLNGNLRWVGARYSVDAGSALSVGHALKFSGGIPPYVSGEVAYANTDARLINVSTRGQVGTGSNQMIVGFVLDGPKTMLVRAAGPALAGFGVSGGLAIPQLTLTSSNGAGTVSTGWQSGGATSGLFARLGAFPFAADSNDAALLQTIPAGNCTAIVSGANGSTGAALVEAYDADPAPGSPSGPRILDVSTRGNVEPGETGTLIAGFVISGTQPRRVLIRAVGPTLAQFGLSNFLPDPVLTLNGSAGVIATNDDWEISRSGPAVAATAQRLGAFALNAASLDAALLITLAPGAYTVIVASADGASGIALVEVYDAD